MKHSSTPTAKLNIDDVIRCATGFFVCIGCLLHSGIASAQEPGVLTTVENAKLVLIDNVTVAARDGGLVLAVPVVEGDLVEQGQILIEFDRDVHEAELEAAVRQRMIAEKESENEVDRKFAQKSAEVSRQLYDRALDANRQFEGSVSTTEMEELRLESERDELACEQADHAREVNVLNSDLRRAQQLQSEIMLDNRRVKAPLDGQVVEVFVQTGEFAGPGEAVMRIVKTSRLKVEAYVPGEFVFKLEKGLPAEFEFSVEEEACNVFGNIVFVSPEIDPANNDIRVMVEIDNADGRFRPGMIGQLKILTK